MNRKKEFRHRLDHSFIFVYGIREMFNFAAAPGMLKFLAWIQPNMFHNYNIYLYVNTSSPSVHKQQ